MSKKCNSKQKIEWEFPARGEGELLYFLCIISRDRKFPARKISRGNREKALYFPRDAGREAGNEIT